MDRKREHVGRNWAVLSSWAPRPVYFAPEVPLDALHRRFPFAQPRDVAGVLRLLMLHELAHHALMHCGLTVSLNAGSREERNRGFEEMEAAADVQTAIFWREGLSSATVRPFEKRVRA